MANSEGEPSCPEEAPGQIQKESKFSYTDLTEEEELQAVEALFKAFAPATEVPYYPLFELFSVCVEFKGERPGELYGYIEATDELGTVSFFDREDDNSEPISSKGLVPLTGPDPCRSISALGALKLDVELYVKFSENEELQVSNRVIHWDFTRIDDRSYYNYYRSFVSAGENENCSVKLFYVSLRHAVEATVMVSFITPDGNPVDVYGSIVAYYGNFEYDDMPTETELYRAVLYHRTKGKSALLQNGQTIPLTRSVVSVPSKCFLIVEACLWDFEDDKNLMLEKKCTFEAKLEDSSAGCIEGEGCSFDLKVDWKCCDTEMVF